MSNPLRSGPARVFPFRLGQPAGGLTPRWLLAHPALTVTVDQPGELVRLLRPSRGRPLARAELARAAAARIGGRLR